MNKYIAFMDLLGTKATAITEPRRYREVIKSFHNLVKDLQESFGEQSPEINVFSDCAYLESSDVYNLCDFLKQLRQYLLFRGICFNAAICIGELGTSINYVEDKKGAIIDFQNEKVVTVYALQSSFSGAGIYIDPAMMQNKKIKKKIEGITVNSIYETINKVNGKTQIHNCIDIKFGTNSFEFLLYILNLFIRCYIMDKSAARYYYTLYATFIGEQNIDVFLNDDMKIIRMILEISHGIRTQNDRLILIMYLVNRLYDIQHELLIETYDNKTIVEDFSIEDIKKPLDYIYTEAKLDELCDLKGIDSEIISDRNKALLAEFCFKKRINSNEVI